MSLNEIGAMPVADSAAANAHLYLWVTNSFLGEGLDVMKQWGFTYKTHLVWTKPQLGLGNYFRNSHEVLFFGVRGRLPTKVNNLMTWIPWPRERHSKKPAVFYNVIEEASPGPYLELFARERRPGWDAWGNEV